jgi:hypothetical protein
MRAGRAAKYGDLVCGPIWFIWAEAAGRYASECWAGYFGPLEGRYFLADEADDGGVVLGVKSSFLFLHIRLLSYNSTRYQLLIPLMSNPRTIFLNHPIASLKMSSPLFHQHNCKCNQWCEMIISRTMNQISPQFKHYYSSSL